jgi:hypothetical protein
VGTESRLHARRVHAQLHERSEGDGGKSLIHGRSRAVGARCRHFDGCRSSKHDIKFVWLYVVGGFAVAISVAFPLFLIARELRVGASDTARLGAADTILLGVVAALVAGQVIWVNLA